MLTIREVAEKTGHSSHKIRRLIKAIAEQPGHADRAEIEPNPTDVERLASEGVQFTWRVTEELVRRELGESAGPSAGEKNATPGVGESADLLSLLQRAIAAKEQAEARLFEQLQTKDLQIAGLQESMKSLNERLRESNLLMASLQKQLPEPVNKPVSVMEAATPARPSASKSKTTGSLKSGRRSWLRKMFG